MIKSHRTTRSLVIESDGVDVSYGERCTVQGATIGRVLVPLAQILCVGVDKYSGAEVYEWTDVHGVGLYHGDAADLFGAVADRFESPRGARRYGLRKIQ